ncbi:hypothetical protein CFP56_034940 [Quercus suber]|uniref:EF-hand domain-containing protein n=1 Tax=Quercus suber TaxID=58331 RepID=A0AAW0JBM3_QUESU
MENTPMLKDWFERVDSEKTGTITAPQLKVQQAFSDRERGRGYIVLDDVYEALVKIVFSLDSPAFYTVCESAWNLFSSFDTAKQGRVTLDLNQFVFCSEYTDSSTREI